jgi:hypothetical protein
MPFTVNGELVEDAVVRAEIRSLRPAYEAETRGMDPAAREAQLRDWSRENVIERVLLRQEAARDPEPVPAEAVEEALRAIEAPDADPAELRRQVEQRLRVDRLLAKVTAKVGAPKHKDVVEYFRKHRERLFRPEQVRAGQVFAARESGRAAMEEVARRLAEGARFEESPGYSALGWVSRGQMAREFEEALLALEPGAMSPVLESAGGFHIFKVYEKKSEGLAEFEEVSEAIADTLWRRKKERAVEQYLDGLRARAVILEV